MDGNVLNTVRRAANGSVIAAAVCALAGAIGGLVTMNILIADNFESEVGATVCTFFMITFWDLARLGSFGMFVGGLISVGFEIFGRDRNKAYSFILLGGSIFGFIGSVMLSIESIYNSTYGSVQNYNYGYGSRYPSGESMIGSLTSMVTTACVFIMVSAVIAFVAVGIAASAGKNPNMFGYAQMPGTVGVNTGADNVWYCPNCGTQNGGSSAICKNCGKYK